MFEVAILTAALLAASADATAGSSMRAAEQDVARLEPVVVVATRSPRPVSDVAGTVDLIDDRTFALEHVSGLENLGRYHIGIDAEGSGTRFGTTGVSIRGIGGNRVAIEVDGVAQGNGFSVGSYSNAGRGPVDPALYSRVEILRGPASTLYGSDAIGGVAAFFTWRPVELAGADGTGHRLRVGFDSALGGSTASLVSAWHGDRGGLVAGVSHRRGDAADHAAIATAEDELRHRSSSGLIGAEWELAPGHALNLSATAYREQRESDLASPLGIGRFRSTTLYLGDDERDGGQLVLDWVIDAPGLGLDDLTVSLHGQQSTIDQATTEERASRDERYQRRFRYEQRGWGAEFAAHRSFEGLGATHRLGFGLEYERRATDERRDGLKTDLAGKDPTTVILGEAFPVRDFPRSASDSIGAWLQDEIQWGRLTLIPGLRFDDYGMAPRPDPLFAADFPDQQTVAVDEADLTPRLAVLVDLGARWSLFGQYAAGFRAPPFEDVNIGLHIPFLNARAVANPELRSETSNSGEIGFRFDGRRHDLSLALFHNRYEDFIESRVPIGMEPATRTLLFQSRNVAAATIEGAELRYRYEPGGRFADFALRAELLSIDGRDDDSGEALATVGPDEALLGLAWAPGRGRLVELVARAAEAGERLGTDTFLAPGYAVVDLLSSWRVGRSSELRLAAFNLADRSYWRHGAARGLAVGDPVIPLLSAPGRSYAATLEIRF